MVYNSFVDFAVSLLIAYERRIIMTYALQSTAWLWQKMVQRVVMSPSLTLSLFSSPVENDIVNCMSNKRIENRINEPESSDFYSEILFNLRLGFVCCVCVYMHKCGNKITSKWKKDAKVNKDNNTRKKINGTHKNANTRRWNTKLKWYHSISRHLVWTIFMCVSFCSSFLSCYFSFSFVVAVA